MAGHTPGPWHIEGRRGDAYWLSAGINAHRDGPETYVGLFDPEPENAEANARLIAAAPDLLEALKACVVDLDDSGQPSAGAALEAAANAIAKAEGRS